jgi:hypothetical protein
MPHIYHSDFVHLKQEILITRAFETRSRGNCKSPSILVAFFLISACAGFFCGEALARDPTNFFVSTTGSNANPGTIHSPFRSIQFALNAATTAGDKVFVRGGRYFEKIRFQASGNQQRGYITLMPYNEEHVILDGTGVVGQNMVLIENKSFIQFAGFEIVNNSNVRDGSGIRVIGSGQAIRLSNHEIHKMRGRNAMGITVYGTSTAKAISRIFIQGNHVHDCDPAPSEAITLNGNVTQFVVDSNIVNDVNNIGIDAIGGEVDINPDPALVARNGRISNNIVARCNSNYGGGFAAGIYVDGGKQITIEGNDVSECDLGIEVGAENAGIVTRSIKVRNNLIYANEKVGLVFGGFAESVGRVESCSFLNNTLYKNDTIDEGYGQIWVSYASFNRVANNIVWAGENKVLMYTELGNLGNRFDYNMYFVESGPNDCSFTWQIVEDSTFDDYRAQSGQDSHSRFLNPRLQTPSLGRFFLKSTSPAIDSGSNAPGWFAPRDIDGKVRPIGAGVDLGAYESGD